MDGTILDVGTDLTSTLKDTSMQGNLHSAVKYNKANNNRTGVLTPQRRPKKSTGDAKLLLRTPEFVHAFPTLFPSDDLLRESDPLPKSKSIQKRPNDILSRDYLATRTRVLHDRLHTDVESLDAAADVAITHAGLGDVDKRDPLGNTTKLSSSASPCLDDIQLCGACFVALASVRCDACVEYFCAVCALERHSDGIANVHTLTTAKTQKHAKLGTVAIGNANDMSISLTQELKCPDYDLCVMHPEQHVKFACETCHFIPVCQTCANTTHSEANGRHKIVEIELAAAEVRELLTDCLTATVKRHNDLSALLSEYEHVCHLADVSLKNGTRSVHCSIQRIQDAIKCKRITSEAEIKNLQQVGSATLNRLMNTSKVYRNYIREKISQLEKLGTLSDPGLALNAFVDLRANFESMLFQDEELPDLVLEIPHWQLYSGNLPNLFAETEYRIGAGVTQVANMCTIIGNMVNVTIKGLANITTAKIPALRDVKVSTASQKFGALDNKPVGRNQGVPKAELRGLFLRKDSRHCTWRQRAVTLSDKILYVHNSDYDFSSAELESKIDVEAVVVKPFDDESVLASTKLNRLAHPNGFEITETSGKYLRFWLFSCECKNVAQLWLTKLRNISQTRRAAAVNGKYECFSQTRFALIDTNSASNPTVQKIKELRQNEIDCGTLPLRSNTDYSSVYLDKLSSDPQAFKVVSDTLVRFKNDSSALYNRCFGGSELPMAPPEVLVNRDVVHMAENPFDSTPQPPLEQVVAVDDPSQETYQEPVSAGRYAMPSSPKMSRTRTLSRTSSGGSMFSQPLHQKTTSIQVPNDLPRFQYSPQVNSPSSIHKMFSELSTKNGKEACDLF